MPNRKISLEIKHFPVMLDKVIEICSPAKGGVYLDCTFGGGGYSEKILKFSKTKVIALDRDKYTLEHAKILKKKYPKRFSFFQKKFSDLDSVTTGHEIDVVIFDLGLSSFQLKNLKRGFSFNSKDSLDMSMGLTKVSAEQVINECNEHKLKLILKILGEEKEANRIVKNIIKFRAIKRITKVNQLVEIIERSKKKDYSKKINPCTKTFQAIRMFVNKELTELLEGLIKAAKILKPGGKILIISFHSLEDKMIKFFFNNFSSNRPQTSRYFPENDQSENFLFEKYKNKIFKPTSSEIAKNFPSRSAKLRFAVRNSNKFTFPQDFTVKFKKYLELESSHV